MTRILRSVDSLIVLNLKVYKNAKVICDYLKKVYNQNNSAKRFQLEHDIINYSQGSLHSRLFFFISKFIN